MVQRTASAPPALTEQLRIWLDGRVYDNPQQATVAGTDHGLVVGDGVFETLKGLAKLVLTNVRNAGV